MAKLKSTITPCGAPGGLEWNGPDDVVEVDDALALDLLGIQDAGFYEVLPEPEPATPKPKAKDEPQKQLITEPDPEAQPE